MKRGEIILGRMQHGFAARQQRQRIMAGQQLARRAFAVAAEMEANWQQCVATLPLYRRLWIAFLIVVKRWGVWGGSGSASGNGGSADAAAGGETEQAACPK